MLFNNIMTLDEEWELYLLVDEILYFLSIVELFKDIVGIEPNTTHFKGECHNH